LTRRRRRSDHFTRRAKQQNYPARSVFKLKEIDQKHSLFKAGSIILDLGCAPGSWLQFASERVGPKGLVVGVDRHGLDIRLPANARYLKQDALSLEPSDLKAIHDGHFDVVLSDMAPHTSGNRFVDQQRSLRLFMRALELATTQLRLGGTFLGKLFQSEDLEFARDEARSSFHSVKIVKPKATRRESFEVYLLCQAMEPPRSPDDSSDERLSNKA
jgi:23S rRNA (uridine2552-2'-O)-methyltransferase